MKRPLAIAAALLAAAAAQAQDNEDGFQTRVFDTAATPGDTRIPILCGGLYKSLAVLFVDDPDGLAAMQKRTEATTNIGIVVHLLDTDSNDKAAATQFIDIKTNEVSAVFAEWFAFNQSTVQNEITDQVRQNYSFCEGHYEQWTTVKPKSE